MRWVVLLLLLVACAQPVVKPAESTTEEKIIEKVIVQCWDGSAASSLEACPPKAEEEKIIAKEVVAPAPETHENVSIAKQLLDQAQSHSGYSFELEDRIVLVSNNKLRHLFSKLNFVDLNPVTDVYVNLENKTAIAYCDIEHEAKIMGKAFTWAKSDCKRFIDKGMPVPFENWVPKGPLDYLADFAEAEPARVENSVQTITILNMPKNIQPSLHYVVNNKRVVLRIDQRSKTLIQVEIEGQQPVGFKEVFFDALPLYGRQEKIAYLVEYKPVSQDWLKTVSQ